MNEPFDRSFEMKISTLYIHRALIYSQLKHLKQQNNFSFRNIIFKERDWNYAQFENISPSKSFLNKYPKDYEITFNEKSCSDNASFCIQNIVKRVCASKKYDVGFKCKSYLTESPEIHFCQEKCFDKNNIQLDLYWDQNLNACRIVNIKKKIFCLKPGTAQVPPLIWSQNENSCKLSREYCVYYGVSFDEDTQTCYVPKLQSLGEFFFGKTLIRGSIHPSLAWYHAYDDDKIYYKCDKQNTFAKLIKTDDLKDELYKDSMALFAVPETSAIIANKSLQYLYNTSKQLDPIIRQNLIMLESNTIYREFLLGNISKYSNTFFKAMGKAFAMEIFAPSFLVDAFDVLKISNEISSLDFKEIMARFDEDFKNSITNDIITPESLLILQSMELKRNDKIREAVDYLYGGVDNITSALKTYYESANKKIIPVENLNLNFENGFDNHLNSLYSKWPIKGYKVLLFIGTLISVSVIFVVTRSFTVLIILVIITLLIMLYLLNISKWN